MIKAEPVELETVKAILTKWVPEYEVRAFGSRVHGENLKPHSDLDLVIMNETGLSPRRFAGLTDAFSESNLLFKVDIVEWALISDAFRALIARHFESFQSKSEKGLKK